MSTPEEVATPVQKQRLIELLDRVENVSVGGDESGAGALKAEIEGADLNEYDRQELLDNLFQYRLDNRRARMTQEEIEAEMRGEIFIEDPDD